MVALFARYQQHELQKQKGDIKSYSADCWQYSGSHRRRRMLSQYCCKIQFLVLVPRLAFPMLFNSILRAEVEVNWLCYLTNSSLHGLS